MSASTAIKEASAQFDLSLAWLRLKLVCPALVDGGVWQEQVKTLAGELLEKRQAAGLNWSMCRLIQQAAAILIAQLIEDAEK